MSAAVELAEKIFTSLAEHEVLVIGAGETSEKTARALQSRGVKKITFTNRSPERAQALAAELGAGASMIPFEQWPEVFERIDIAVSSTAAPHHILDRARLEPLMKRRRHRPLLLIDIAVPRDIDPAVSELDNVFLYNVDDLKAIADEYLKLRHEELNRCNQIIAEKVAVLLEANRHSAAVFHG
jgi:glutamyl-tRNA reductase